MNVNGRKLTVMAIVLFIATLFAFCLDLPDDSSDYSEAASLPTIDVCRTEDGSSLSGKGAILDDAVLNTKTSYEDDKLVYSVESGSVLVSGDTYVIINGDRRPSFSMTGHMFGKNDFLQQTGLTLLLYTSPLCYGTPVCSADFTDGNERILGDGLRSGVPYYIKVIVTEGAVFDEAPRLGGIGFSLTVYTTSDFNALYFDDGDGNIVSEQLVRNGDRYQLPEVEKEGKVLIGWYTSREHDVLVRSTDTVSLKQDTTLYAFWWNGGAEEIEYTTLDGSYVNIRVKTDGGVFVDINARSADGSIIIDIVNLDISQVSMEILLKAMLSDDHSVFTVEDAKHAVDMYSIVRTWMASNGLKPTANVNADAEGEVRAVADALAVLSENGFSFETESVDGVKFKLDSLALNELYAMGAADSVVEIINRKAVDSDLTPEQIGAREDYLVWIFRVFVDGIPVDGFADGSIHIQISYGPLEDYQTLHVSLFAEDGSYEDIECGYSSEIISIDTHSVSTYLVRTTGSKGFPVGIAVLGSAAAVIGAGMLVIEILRRKH